MWLKDIHLKLHNAHFWHTHTHTQSHTHTLTHTHTHTPTHTHTHTHTHTDCEGVYYCHLNSSFNHFLDPEKLWPQTRASYETKQNKLTTTHKPKHQFLQVNSFLTLLQDKLWPRNTFEDEPVQKVQMSSKWLNFSLVCLKLHS
jgi:hypothetical protein